MYPSPSTPLICTQRSSSIFDQIGIEGAMVWNSEMVLIPSPWCIFPILDVVLSQDVCYAIYHFNCLFLWVDF
jgi:hypothetical protein